MFSIQQLCWALQTTATDNRYLDASIAFMIIVIVQLLVIPIQIVLDLHHINLPASILVMLLAVVSTLAANCVSDRVAVVYQRYLRGPTDFLSRHMTFGFVASFVLLSRDHITNASDVPRIVGAFAVTTIIGYLLSFVIALGGHRVEQRLRVSQRSSSDLERDDHKTWPSPSIAWPAPPSDRYSKRISYLSSLSGSIPTSSSALSSNRPGSWTSVLDIVVQHGPISVCVFLLATIGLPTYFVTGYMLAFDVFTFTLFWILSLQIQKSLRSSVALLTTPRWRAFIIILANPLLLTWGLGTAYLWLNAFSSGKDISTVVGQFQHYNTFSKSIVRIIHDRNIVDNLGAGDLASLLLDAGVTCMGFKIFEYRAELWESLGTVSITCTILATVNVFVNVLIGHAFGLPAAEAISFASRSATLALGVPAIENLGGSTTFTSTLVIVGGILFQMSGDWLLSVLRVRDQKTPEKRQPRKTPPADTSTLFSGTAVVRDTEKGHASHSQYGHTRGPEDSTVVAAGVTAGINGAALGTAFLIERHSRATAYSALSMIMFGAATVALSALPGVAETASFLASR